MCLDLEFKEENGKGKEKVRGFNILRPVNPFNFSIFFFLVKSLIKQRLSTNSKTKLPTKFHYPLLFHAMLDM